MKQVFRIFAMSSAVMLAGVSGIQARLFHLSPDGIDDAGRGTSSQPWKTVTYATGRMQAGDTLALAEGTYTAETRIDVKNGGSQSAPMVIRGQGAQRPVIDLGYIKPVSGLPSAAADDTWRLAPGQSGRSGGEDQNRAVHVNVSHVVLEGLVIQGGNTAIWGAGWSGDLTGLTIRDCLIRYHEQYALRLDQYNDVSMSGCEVYHCGLVNWPRGSHGWPHAIIGYNAERVVIRQCAVHDNHGEGVGPFLGCAFWEVRGCEVYDNWSVNIYIDLDGSDAVVDGNLVYNTGKYGTEGRNNPDGVRIANEIADMDYSGCGIAQDPTPAVDSVTVTNNIVVNTGGGICAYPYDPYRRFALRGSLVANNTIVRVPEGHAGLRIVGDGVEVANNLVAGCALPTELYDVGAGIDAHHNTVTADGGFTGGTGYLADDYRLLATSPAVGSGATLPASGPARVRRDRGAVTTTDLRGRAIAVPGQGAGVVLVGGNDGMRPSCPVWRLSY